MLFGGEIDDLTYFSIRKGLDYLFDPTLTEEEVRQITLERNRKKQVESILEEERRKNGRKLTRIFST